MASKSCTTDSNQFPTPKSALIPFQFHDAPLSVITKDNGESWFIAAEACRILALDNVSQAVSRLDPDEKDTITLNDALHSELKTVIISESGLYSLTLSSRKKIAKEFKRWVTHEVIPAIRKTGTYSIPRLHNPMSQVMIDMVMRVDALEYEVAQQKEENIRLVATMDRIDTKADMALDDVHRMTVEEYVFTHQLIHQYPPSMHAQISKWLLHFCQQCGVPVTKARVLGKRWDAENSYPIQAFMAFERSELKRPTQITLVKEPPQMEEGDA